MVNAHNAENTTNFQRVTASPSVPIPNAVCTIRTNNANVVTTMRDTTWTITAFVRKKIWTVPNLILKMDGARCVWTGPSQQTESVHLHLIQVEFGK